jgi:uncharacterized membrane protein
VSRFDKTPQELAMEQVIGRVLQAGVVLAAAVVLVGAIMLLVQHGSTPPDFHAFAGEPEGLRSLGGILSGSLALDAAAVVQLGLVLLIATPVLRVALTLVGFAVQRDRLYVAVTAIVLAILLWSIVGAS